MNIYQLDIRKRKDPFRSSLRQRLIAGFIISPLAVVVVVVGGPLLLLVASVLAMIMMWEWLRPLELRGGALILWAIYPIALLEAMQLAAAGTPLLGAGVLGLGAGLVSVIALLINSIKFRSLAPVGIIYIGLTGIAFISVRGDGAIGMWVVLWLFGLVWSFDVCAYLAGRRFGRASLWPALSPDKTWEGFWGGAAAAAVMGAIFAHWLPFMNFAQVVLVSVGFAVVAQLGDLLESAVKRVIGVKDMSRLIPGHGGVLDRLDALSLVLIVAWLAKLAFST